MPPQQPDPGLRAPVDPYQSPPAQPGYDQGGGYGSPAYPSYGDPGGYADPASGYPGPQQPYPTSSPGYVDQGYATPSYDQGYADQGYPQQAQPYYQPQPQQQPGYGGPGYPGSPGYPPAPSGGGGGSRGLIVGLVVVLALILVGGGIGTVLWLTSKKTNTPVAGSTTGPAPLSTSGGSTPTPTPTAAATHSGDLRNYLIPPPSGSRNWPTPIGTDRNLSLDQASELSSDPKARKDMLNQYSFTKGAVQCWITSGGTAVVDVRLYQFDTTDHASSFFDDNISATGGGYTAGNTADVVGVPGAKSFADPKKDAQGYVSIISIGLKGDVVFVVSIGEKGDKIDLVSSDALMKQQLAKL